jgi:hypothetical protein
MKTRYSALIAVGHRRADGVREPAGGEPRAQLIVGSETCIGEIARLAAAPALLPTECVWSVQRR